MEHKGDHKGNMTSSPAGKKLTRYQVGDGVLVVEPKVQPAVDAMVFSPIARPMRRSHRVVVAIL